MDPDLRIAAAARAHHGLVTRRQILDAGLTPRQLHWRLQRGRLEAMEPGVYRLPGAPDTWRQRVLAAAWAEDAFASHRTAGALCELDGCRPGIIEVQTARWRRRPNRSIRLHETRVLDDQDVAVVDGIPTMSPERTIVDLAMVVPPPRVEMAIDTPGVDMEAVWRCVERLDTPGRPWVAVPRRLVAARLGRGGVSPNLFERRLFDILLQADIPLPTPQVEVRRPDGSLLRRTDWLYERTRLDLECDSFLWHGAWRRRKRDLRGDRELTGLGYRVLRFTWEDLDDTDLVVADVLGAIHAASA
jgi:hypothetical protein